MCTQAFAWGPAGHQIIADIAYQHLTDHAKKQVQRIAPGRSLASLSNWADKIRYNRWIHQPHTAWHYLNIDSPSQWHKLYAKYKKINGASACKSTPTTQPENLLTGLSQAQCCLTSPHHKNCHMPPWQALRWMIHLVGDAHEPLHLGHKKDLGGNQINILWQGKKTTLHRLWDGKIIKKHTKNHPHSYWAKQWDIKDHTTLTRWQSTAPIEWLSESYHLSEATAYQTIACHTKNKTTLCRLPSGYEEKSWPIIKQRLQQAGIRLAGMLNTIWTTS